MKKLIILAGLLALLICLGTSAFASTFTTGSVYWLNYSDAYFGYQTAIGGHYATAISMTVYDTTKTGNIYSKGSNSLGSLDTFCLTVLTNLDQSSGGYAAQYTDLPVGNGAAYLLGNYTARNDYAWNAALQAAIWNQRDGMATDYSFAKTAANMTANDWYSRFVADANKHKASWVSTTAGFAGGGLGGYGGSQGLGIGTNPQNTPPSVPESSTLAGFGSGLLTFGPGMIAWLRSRKA